MNKIIGFREDGLRGLHFYIRGMEYPVVAAEYTAADSYAFECLDASVKAGKMDSESICEWCMNHRIYFRILYGVRVKNILKDPKKTIRFLKLRSRLRQYSSAAGAP